MGGGDETPARQQAPAVIAGRPSRPPAGAECVREIDDEEGQRLLRIVRRGTGSVVTWRRAQMVLLSAQGMEVAAIARAAFTSKDRVRDVIHNFNADGFSSLYPKYKGGRPPKFTLARRREIKKIAMSKPAEHGLAFSAWSLSKLGEFLVAEGVVDDISQEGLRVLLREEGVTFQRLKTWKTSAHPGYAVKKARVEHLYAIADREVIPEPGEPEVIFCVDESGPLNLQPHPGRQRAAVSGKNKEPGRKPRPRCRATSIPGRMDAARASPVSTWMAVSGEQNDHPLVPRLRLARSVTRLTPAYGSDLYPRAGGRWRPGGRAEPFRRRERRGRRCRRGPNPVDADAPAVLCCLGPHAGGPDRKEAQRCTYRLSASFRKVL